MNRFPWIVLVAYAVYWFAPRINRWIDRPPRRDSIELIREDEELRRQWTEWAETVHRNNDAIRGTLLRPGRELDRGDR